MERRTWERRERGNDFKELALASGFPTTPQNKHLVILWSAVLANTDPLQTANYRIPAPVALTQKRKHCLISGWIGLALTQPE